MDRSQVLSPSGTCRKTPVKDPSLEQGILLSEGLQTKDCYRNGIPVSDPYSISAAGALSGPAFACVSLSSVPASIFVYRQGAGYLQKAAFHRLLSLIRGGLTPVMAPLTHDGMGHILNTNADTIAAETAKALAREGASTTLVYCFEKAGVLADPDDEGSVISTINHDEFVRLVANGTISGGMIPKITNALVAVDAGVERVIITKAENIGTSTGTVITR